jgi:hypothetical protein
MKRPAATGSGQRRNFRWRPRAKATRLDAFVGEAGSWLGKRNAVMVSGEREIVGVQIIGEGDEGLVQIPGRAGVSGGIYFC